MPCRSRRIAGFDRGITLVVAGLISLAATSPRQTLLPGATPEQRLERVRADLFGTAPRLDENIRELTALLAIDPRNAEAHLLLGMAYRAQGKPEMVGETKAEFQQALDLNPGLLPARLLLAQTYFDQGRFDKARDELHTGLARAPGQPQFLALLAETSRQLGDARQAVEIARKVLQVDPAMGQARYYLGLALIDLGERDEAIKQFEDLVKAGMKLPDVLFALGSAYLDAGRLDEAVSTLSEGVQVAPGSAEIRLALARAYRSKGTLAQAERELKQAQPTESDRQPSAAYQQMEAKFDTEWGALRLAQGRLVEAVAALEKAIKMAPEHGPAHRYLSEVLFRQGLFSRSLQEAQRAEKLGTPLPEALRKAIAAKAGKQGGVL